MDYGHNPHMIGSFGRSFDSHLTCCYAVFYGPISQSRNPWPNGSAACRSGNVDPILRARWEMHGLRLLRASGVRSDTESENPSISCECIPDYDGIIRLQPRQRRRGSPQGACCGCGCRKAAGSRVPRASHTIRPGPSHHLRGTQAPRLQTPLRAGPRDTAENLRTPLGRGGRRARVVADPVEKRSPGRGLRR